MVVSRQEDIQANIKIGNKTLKQVNTSKYLGQIITPDGRNENEIKAKIAIAKKQILTNV